MIIGFKKPGWVFSLLVCCLLVANPVFAQNGGNPGDSGAASVFAQRLTRGVNFYRESRWTDAIAELRLAQAEAANTRQRSEALYWIALAELSASEYESALRDMDDLERLGGSRTVDIAYHRGRAYYYLGYYEEAIVLLNEYASKAGEGEKARVSSAYYWIGECLLALGQSERARDFFQLIIERYPGSVKHEAASYRIALINQKKVETELLALLKWSHEESLKTIEDYRRRERSYDQALNVYQKEAAETLRDSRLADLENANAEYRRQLTQARERIQALENSLETQSAAAPAGNDLRAWATQLRSEMEKDARSLEDSGGSAP